MARMLETVADRQVIYGQWKYHMLYSERFKLSSNRDCQHLWSMMWRYHGQIMVRYASPLNWAPRYLRDYQFGIKLWIQSSGLISKFIQIVVYISALHWRHTLHATITNIIILLTGYIIAYIMLICVMYSYLYSQQSPPISLRLRWRCAQLLQWKKSILILRRRNA